MPEEVHPREPESRSRDLIHLLLLAADEMDIYAQTVRNDKRRKPGIYIALVIISHDSFPTSRFHLLVSLGMLRQKLRVDLQLHLLETGLLAWIVWTILSLHRLWKGVKRLARIIDLSHPISNEMPVFPGDPPVEFKRVHTLSNGGYNVTQVTMGTHTGTHVDVPFHVMPDPRGVDSISLAAVVGWAEVLDLGELEPGTDIRAADLDAFAHRVNEGARLLLRTGWGKYWGHPDFFTNFPNISEGAAVWLTARKVKLVGVEQPSVHLSQHREIHKALLSTGMALIETIANMDQLTQDRVYLVALPMKLVGLDGSPMRVIAIEGMEETK